MEIDRIIQEVRRGNTTTIYNELMQNNPQFKDFVSKNQGKPIDQIAREYGINPMFLKLLR